MSAIPQRSKHSKQWISYSLLLLCAIAAPWSVSPAQTPIQTRARTDFIGKPAPLFYRRDLRGRRIGLPQYRGKVVLLNFWATWCAPCLTEIPVFISWQKQYGQGLQVIGISMDDDVPTVLRMFEQYPVNYPVGMGDAKLGELYGGVLGLPVTFLIDTHGIVVKRYEGAVDLKQLEREVQQLLPKQ